MTSPNDPIHDGLPNVEPFTHREVDAILCGVVAVGIDGSGERINVALEPPPEAPPFFPSFVYQTSAAGARQLAAVLLNHADLLDQRHGR